MIQGWYYREEFDASEGLALEMSFLSCLLLPFPLVLARRICVIVKVHLVESLTVKINLTVVTLGLKSFNDPLCFLKPHVLICQNMTKMYMNQSNKGYTQRCSLNSGDLVEKKFYHVHYEGKLFFRELNEITNFPSKTGWKGFQFAMKWI